MAGVRHHGPPDAGLESGISMGFQQHIHTPLCVLKARYLHRAYYTYLIHEIILECVQLYGHNSILSGVVAAWWRGGCLQDVHS